MAARAAHRMLGFGRNPHDCRGDEQDGEGGQALRRLAVVIAAAVLAALDHDFANAAPEQFVDGARFRARAREQRDFVSARQEHVGVVQNEVERIAHLGFFDYLDTIAMVGGLEHVLGPILGRNLLGVGLKAAQEVYAKRKGTTLAQLLEADQRCSCGRTSGVCTSSLAVTA